MHAAGNAVQTAAEQGHVENQCWAHSKGVIFPFKMSLITYETGENCRRNRRCRVTVSALIGAPQCRRNRPPLEELKINTIAPIKREEAKHNYRETSVEPQWKLKKICDTHWEQCLQRTPKIHSTRNCLIISTKHLYVKVNFYA